MTSSRPTALMMVMQAIVIFLLIAVTAAVVAAEPRFPPPIRQPPTQSVNLTLSGVKYLYLRSMINPTETVVKSGLDLHPEQPWNISKIPANYTLLAEAWFTPSLKDIGWDSLYLRPNATMMMDNSTVWEAWEAAGYLEGYITHRQILHQSNFWSNIRPTDPKVTSWVADHINFMHSQVYAQNKTSKFWRQVGFLLKQIEGLKSGYNAQTDNFQDFLDFFFLNFGDEVGDVKIAIEEQNRLRGDMSSSSVEEPTSLFVQKRMHANRRHCSALIKPTPDDLFVSHVTWSSFESMRRMYKVYDFAPTALTMSSYPAQIASNDDWYQTSNMLAVQETTNEVFNTTLYLAVVPQTVSEFLRVMAANFLSTHGEEWTFYFSQHNSGTYNNQYMVVNFNLYSPGSKISSGTLWIAEQIPGLVKSGDVSHVLRDQGYWASYNIPFFEEIYNVSGYREMLALQGSFWSYSNYARPMIFKRNQSSIANVSDMQKMMRYNDYHFDNLSLIPNCHGANLTSEGFHPNECNPKHSAMLTIASRGDLNPPGGEKNYGVLYDFVGQRDHCATDAKIALWSEAYTMNSRVISGPTTDQQPVFAFSTAPVGGPIPRTAPAGMPDSWNFPWINFRINYASAPPPPVTPHPYQLEGNSGVVIGTAVACVVVFAIVAFLVHYFFLGRKAVNGSGDDAKPLRGSMSDV